MFDRACQLMSFEADRAEAKYETDRQSRVMDFLRSHQDGQVA